MKILCCGDRDWSNEELIYEGLCRMGRDTVVVHGNARGADKMCDAVAKRLGYVTIPYDANWEQHGRSAGPIRNRQMYKEHPDIQFWLAFHNNFERSRGTRDMVGVLMKAGVPGIKLKDRYD